MCLIQIHLEQERTEETQKESSALQRSAFGILIADS